MSNAVVADVVDDVDILEPILTDDELIEFLNIYKQNLPDNIRSYYFIILQLKWRKLMKMEKYQLMNISPMCKYNLYKCADGNLKNATLIGIAEDDQTIYFCTKENDCTELKLCLEQTKRIKWDQKKPIFQSISSTHKHLQILYDLLKERKLEVDWYIDYVGVWLSVDVLLNYKYEIPEDMYWNKLKPNDSVLIDSLWAHSFPGSQNYIRSLIILNGGVGLFRKETNELICWALVNDLLSVGFLQTIESEKRKGYAMIIIKLYSENFYKNECLPPIATIGLTNFKSRNIFNKLKYKEFDECSWVALC